MCESTACQPGAVPVPLKHAGRQKLSTPLSLELQLSLEEEALTICEFCTDRHTNPTCINTLTSSTSGQRPIRRQSLSRCSHMTTAFRQSGMWLQQCAESWGDVKKWKGKQPSRKKRKREPWNRPCSGDPGRSQSC